MYQCHTVASAFNNRIVTFVNPTDDYNCVICHHVADKLVRCSGYCAGMFCKGCTVEYLSRGSTKCPVCNIESVTLSDEPVLRGQIEKLQIYCPNNGTNQSIIDLTHDDATVGKKRKASPDETESHKCVWKSKYGELATHLKECRFASNSYHYYHYHYDYYYYYYYHYYDYYHIQ